MKDDPVAVVFFGGPLHDQHHVLRDPLPHFHAVYSHSLDLLAAIEEQQEPDEQVAVETFEYELMSFYCDGLAVYLAMLEEDMDD
jgi:hypothetical protein